MSSLQLSIPASAYVEALADESVDVADEAMTRAEVRQLLALLMRLPRRDRHLLCRRYGIGRSPQTVREVAAWLGVGTGTAHEHEQLALARLRVLYERALRS